MIVNATSLLGVVRIGIKNQGCNKDEAEVLNLSDRMNFPKIVYIYYMESSHKINNVVSIYWHFSLRICLKSNDTLGSD